jgi:hypothetical protein
MHGKKNAQNRKTMEVVGGRGSRVRLARETRKTRDGKEKVEYVVRWGSKGNRQQKSWAGNADGKARAQAFFAGFKATNDPNASGPKLITRELWTRYLADPKTKKLRERSLALYTNAWKQWEEHWGASKRADAFTDIDIGTFVDTLEARGLATATIDGTLRPIRTVYKWAKRKKLIGQNSWQDFVRMIGTDEKTQPRAEFRAWQTKKILGELDPKKKGQWRAWVAIGFQAIYGARGHEILRMQWSWIEGELVTIPGGDVKTGDPVYLTLFPDAYDILRVAYDWRETLGYTGGYILFTGKDKCHKNASKNPHYSIQTLTNHIHAAEKRAGIPTIKFRAGHGFRRGLVGDVAEQTGDSMFALHVVGDKSVQMLKHYRNRRDPQVNAAIQGRAASVLGQRPENGP